MGVVADLLASRMPGGILTMSEFNAVLHEFPYLDFKGGLKKLVSELCVHKAETTYDNAVRDFGEHFVTGYDPTPGNAVRRLLQPIDI